MGIKAAVIAASSLMIILSVLGSLSRPEWWCLPLINLFALIFLGSIGVIFVKEDRPRRRIFRRMSNVRYIT